MTTEEKVLLGLAFTTLAAVVVFHVRIPGVNTVPDIPPATAAPDVVPSGIGLNYLTYNTADWAFGPPVSNIMPDQTSGMIGEISSACGCNSAYRGGMF